MGLKGNAKIVIFIKTFPSEKMHGVQDLLHRLFNEINSTAGITIEKVGDNEFHQQFELIELFKQYWQEMIRSIPGEEYFEKPFVIRTRIEHNPDEIDPNCLIEMMQQRYSAMHVPFNAMGENEIYEIRFPGESAYLASFFELLDLSISTFSPTYAISPTQILHPA